MDKAPAQARATPTAAPRVGTTPTLAQSIGGGLSSAVQLIGLPLSAPNRTGFPDGLTTGIEAMLDHVKVQYNLAQPAQLNAMTDARASEIHLAPGLERHPPLEAWHVVQQAYGRVKPTLQMQMKEGVLVNDDAGLEHEAEVMGARALQSKWNEAEGVAISPSGGNAVVQRRKVGKFGLEAEVMEGNFQISAPKDSVGGNLIQDAGVSFEEYKLADLGGLVSVTLDGEVSRQTPTRYLRSYTVEYVQRPVDVDLVDVDGVNAVAAAWTQALDFWQAHLNDPHAFKTELGDWYTLQKSWRGGQFEDRQQTPGVTHEEGQEAQFDWTNDAYVTAISAQEVDPNVAMQLTAGSTLLGLLEVYLETASILRDGVPASGELRATINQARQNTETRPEAVKLTNLIFLIGQYISGNGNTMDDRERSYAKEYVTLMSRTTLDVVYQQLNASAKQVFDTQVANYLFHRQPDPLGDRFQRPPEARVFVKNAAKEDVSGITIEQLLLSIIKQNRAAVGEVLEPSGAPVDGDVLVQHQLQGLGEINPQAPDMLEKFGLNSAGEMMQGLPGMIFENRGAKLHKLSAMPDLFRMLAVSLRQVNVAHEQALARQAQQRMQSQAPKPVSDTRCYLTTACVTQRGLPDDCEALQVLRAFRDEVIAPLPIGPELIACYYRQAPRVVATIDAHADQQAIYERIYGIINFCVDAIKQGHDAIALTAYCEMVIGLEQVLEDTAVTDYESR